MDGVHDLGGLQGFGRVEEERSEPVFHAPWEARIFALASAAPFAAGYGDDQLRPAIERIAPDRYLAGAYYAKWLEATVTLLAERGLVSEAELQGGPVAPLPQDAALAPALSAGQVPQTVAGGASQARPGSQARPRLGMGQAVRTLRHRGSGHTRLPRYARGRAGRIEAVHGAFLVADRNSLGDPTPDILYTVSFAMTELWGSEAPAGDRLCLDLWECYLEPAA